jgi:hypothetical protein
MPNDLDRTLRHGKPIQIVDERPQYEMRLTVVCGTTVVTSVGMPMGGAVPQPLPGEIITTQVTQMGMGKSTHWRVVNREWVFHPGGVTLGVMVERFTPPGQGAESVDEEGELATKAYG